MLWSNLVRSSSLSPGTLAVCSRAGSSWIYRLHSASPPPAPPLPPPPVPLLPPPPPSPILLHFRSQSISWRPRPFFWAACQPITSSAACRPAAISQWWATLTDGSTHTADLCVCVCVCVCVCRFRPVQYQDTGPVVKDKHGIRDRLIKNNKTQWTLLNTPPTVMSQQWCHNTLADECLWLLHCLCSLERKSRVTTKLIFTTYYIRRQGPPHINKAKQYKLCCSLFISQWRSFSLILKTCNIS